MAHTKRQSARLDPQTLENLRTQIQSTIRANCRNNKIVVANLIVSELSQPNSRSNRAGGPIDITVENADSVDVPSRLWIKIANHPHSGFFGELQRLYALSVQHSFAGLIPRPYAYDAETALLVTEFVRGRCPLGSFIGYAAIGNSDRIISLAKDAGEWLARFHSLDWSNDGPSIQEWAAPLCDRMIKSRLYSKDAVEQLVTSKEFVRARRMRLPVTRLHKDFTLRNVLYTENGLNVIDWDAMGHPESPDKDPPWNDIGACLINLESQIRYFPLVRNKSLRLFERAMLDSYELSCPDFIGPRRLASLLVRLKYDVELIGPSLSKAYPGLRGATFRHLFRRRLRKAIYNLGRT